MASGDSSRVYRSSLRERQADETRRRVIEAAGVLFSAHGFQSTTMAAIAREAGVSTETVKATGGKSDLLIAAFERTFAGVEGEASLTDTPVAGDLLSLSDADFRAGVVVAIAGANARGHALWTVVLGAALSDEAVSAALTTILANRRADYRRLVSELARRGALVEDPDAAADTLSFLLSPEGYQHLVVQSGWSAPQYRAWLCTMLTAAVGSVGA